MMRKTYGHGIQYLLNIQYTLPTWLDPREVI